MLLNAIRLSIRPGPWIRSALPLIVTVVSAFSRPTISAQQPTPAATPQAGLPSAAADSVVLQVADGRLTLKVRSRRLDWILDRLTHQAGIAIQTAGGAGAELVTIDMQDMPLDDALRQLLRNHDAFFFYGTDKPDKFAGLQVVWIYPKGKGVGLQPVPPESWASTNDLKISAFGSANPETRSSAVAALIERGGSEVSQLALRAITEDPDSLVRSNALFAARAHGVDIDSNVLMNLLAVDPSPDVRFLALQALGNDKAQAKSAAEFGLNDPDLHVQAAAQEILRRLSPPARGRAPQTQPPQPPKGRQ